MNETEALNDCVFAFDLNTLTFYVVGRQPLPTFFHDLTVVPGVSSKLFHASFHKDFPNALQFVFWFRYVYSRDF